MKRETISVQVSVFGKIQTITRCAGYFESFALKNNKELLTEEFLSLHYFHDNA